MEQLKELSLAKIVLLKPATASVFEKYNLDFCCKGKQNLASALEGNESLLNQVNSELNSIFNTQDFSSSFKPDTLSLSQLIEYIIENHHRYVKEILPVIYAHTQKIANKHGERHPELIAIAELFSQIKEDFEQHLAKEEEILFPKIIELEKLKNGKIGSQLTIGAPIQAMMMEHELAGKLTQDIKSLSKGYTPPMDACTTYQLTFAELKEFELNLHQHVHLENNILFPKALELFAN